MDISKFFSGSKKRDHSDDSDKGEDPKKVKEGEYSFKELPEEVFAEGLASPECTKMLFNFLKSIENQVNMWEI